MASGNDSDELTERFENINLNDMGGCAGKSDERVKKKQMQKEYLNSPLHTVKVLRIRRGISLDIVREEKKAIEKATHCSISLAKKEDEEPTYFKSWVYTCRSIVIAEGNVENSVTDIIVCPIDEYCQPAGRSAERIFQKGGWTVLENAAKCSKNEHEKDHGTGDANWLYSSSTTGSLNCRRIWFVHIKKLRDSMELLSNTLYDEVRKNYWRSIYFPVESSQIENGTVQKMAEALLKPSANKQLIGMEIVLCVSRGSRDCKQLDEICKKYLEGNRVISFYNETPCNVDGFTNIQCLCLPSPIEVKIEIESILDIAKKGEVDVIVNSTNQKLKLNEGSVSSLILKHGGIEIQQECSDHGHISIGDVTVSRAGELGCKKIIHCVLIDWISTGNLSLKVLSSLVKKCLHEVEKLHLKTIAFPALGTGNLEYPYIHVARTMQKAVYEYGIVFPKTCIKRVIFALHKGDRECIKTFQDVHDSTQIVKDFVMNPTIKFLENRISKSGLLIQLMSQEINEPVDAIINFKPSHSSSKHGQREQGANGPVALTWCKEKGCYTGTYTLGEDMKLMVEECFTKLEVLKITSTRIDIRNIDASKGFETVMNAFCDNLTAAPRIAKGSKIRYLRKLQILACHEEIEKVEKSQQKKSAEAESSFFVMKWITNLLKSGECDEKWKVAEKTHTKHMVCCLSGETEKIVENAWELLKRKFGSNIQGFGKWCFCQNYSWKFLSKICNIKLMEAEEKDLNEVDITDEDGITHTYNLEDYDRTQKNPPADVRKEKILFIQGCETSLSPPISAMWAAFHKGQWIFLSMECCHLLNIAARQKMTEVNDYVYDLKKMKRRLRNNSTNDTWEGILCIEAAKHFTEDKTQNGPKADLTIFECVTGMVMYPEVYGKDFEKIVKDAGCFVLNGGNHSSVQISGNLEGIENVNLHLTKKKREDMNKRNSEDGTDFVICIPMSMRDYEAVSYFGDKDTKWFKNISNNMKYIDGSLCVYELNVGDGQDIEEKLKELLKKVQSMACDNTPVEKNKIDIQKVMQEVGKMIPNVCLFLNENDRIIEILSENYNELLHVKSLLMQKMIGKVTGRRNRTFENVDSQQNLQSTEEAKRDFKPNETSVIMNQSIRCPKLEFETKEGLKIMIYAGSITRLDVDCIVNAANEHLMHGGGVAAAISEAAGYEFDQESRDYIQKNGPIPVGTCCATSAGKLPYKYVIHTVGPRWSDYRNKNQCLHDLQKSVGVTFRKANEMGMKTIAIPAISSGIFGVPRENCTEEYYNAAMSFSNNNYPFKSLREIHFVDRDESMVKAIQEIFRQKEVPKSTHEKSENPGKEKEIPADGAENSAQAAIPDPNLYTIVHVSENFQVKIHLGNITDIAADAIVCPQDEYLSSIDDIAVEIFKKLPYAPKSSNEKKTHGDISSQTLEENSPWKIIIHAVTPRYDCNYSKDIRKFGAVLKTVVESIIEAADKAKVCSVAIPLLGTGKEDFKTPVELCASNFFKAVMDSQSKVSSLKDIYLVLDNKDVEEMYLGAFKYTCKITPRAVSKVANSKSIRNFGKTLTDLPKNEENCCICMDKLTDPKKLQKCGHLFCKDCIDQYFKYKPACPSCGQIYGKMTGDQPPGSITIRKDYQLRLEGFNDSTGCIILTYAFQSGRQGPEHPEQGKWYKGISRSGYLPNNDTGRLVAKLLNVAFSRRLVFTIGRSRTTGHEGVITWNDIHHKTRPGGGPAQFGYPDPTYLDRVLEELEAKGVTEESADDPEEYKEYSKLFSY